MLQVDNEDYTHDNLSSKTSHVCAKTAVPALVGTGDQYNIDNKVASKKRKQNTCENDSSNCLGNAQSCPSLSSCKSSGPPIQSPLPQLVHSFQDALRNSQASSLSTPPPPSCHKTSVATQQWQKYHDDLFLRVLSPHLRSQHMQLIVSSSELNFSQSDAKTATVAGRYLRVFDVTTDHDKIDVGGADIIQQLIMSAKQYEGQKFSDTISPIDFKEQSRQLQQALSIPISTQPSLCQYSLSSSSSPSKKGSNSPPSVHSHFIRGQSDVYARLVEASAAARQLRSCSFQSTSYLSNPHRNIFTPTISIECVKDPNLKQHLKAAAKACQQHYQQYVQHLHHELECDHVFAVELDGFGVEGLQLYFKCGESVTWLHDELLWCAALNYMLKESIGCSLWIAIGLHHLKQKMSVEQIDTLFRYPKSDVIEVGYMLDKLIQADIPIEYVLQKPGQLVSSPPGIGAAHLVYSNGVLTTQLAWNYSFTMPGALDSLSFWGGPDNECGHVSLDNGSMATRSVLPLFTMQENGYDFNLVDKINFYQNKIKQLIQRQPHQHTIQYRPVTQSPHCKKCLYRQDWLTINHQCIHCFFASTTS